MTALQNLSRSLSQAALAAGDTAAASAQLIGIGANVSASIVTASLGGLAGAHTAAMEAWRGVDVVNVTASRSNLRAISKDPAEMQAYLEDGSVLGDDPETLLLVMRCAANATRRLEILDLADKAFSSDGAYSSVFKVRRHDDNDIYALKKVKMLQLSDKEKENALNEVRILASIKHPSICSYKEAFIDEPSSSLW